MKLIIAIFITLGIVVSVFSYLDISIFTGPLAALFGGEIWETFTDFLAIFGGFFTRVFQNQYILLLIANYIIFYVLHLFIDLLRAKKAGKKGEIKNDNSNVN